MSTEFNQLKEVPIIAKTLQAGDKVIVASYTLYGNKPTRYAYGQVTSISPTKHIVTVGTQRYDGTSGYLYTSKHEEKYARRLLQVTGELVSYIHRQDLLGYLHNIVWETHSTFTLEAVYHAFVAGMNIDTDEAL